MLVGEALQSESAIEIRVYRNYWCYAILVLAVRRRVPWDWDARCYSDRLGNEQNRQDRSPQSNHCRSSGHESSGRGLRCISVWRATDPKLNSRMTGQRRVCAGPFVLRRPGRRHVIGCTSSTWRLARFTIWFLWHFRLLYSRRTTSWFSSVVIVDHPGMVNRHRVAISAGMRSFFSRLILNLC